MVSHGAENLCHRQNQRATIASRKLSESEYRVSVQAPAQDGKANQALIELLARYFDIPKTMLRIIRGRSSRQKLIEIDK
jgi:uncharacterized protein